VAIISIRTTWCFADIFLDFASFAYLAMKNRIKALTEYRRTFRHSQAKARGDSLYALSVDFLVAV
jgi:hypothetical protein